MGSGYFHTCAEIYLDEPRPVNLQRWKITKNKQKAQ